MEWIALILALLAIAVFIATHFGVQRRWANIALGLALLAGALLIWHAVGGLEPIITVND